MEPSAKKAKISDADERRQLLGTTLSDIKLLKVPHLSDSLPESMDAKLPAQGIGSGGAGYNKVMKADDVIIGNLKLKTAAAEGTIAYLRAGPRATTFFDPAQVNAAIVTCGGLCPGLNAVIRELTNSLHSLYGAKRVYGIRGGYAGFYEGWTELSDPKVDRHIAAAPPVVTRCTTLAQAPLILTTENTAGVQHQGGTMLGSARGGFDEGKILAFCEQVTSTALRCELCAESTALRSHFDSTRRS